MPVSKPTNNVGELLLKQQKEVHAVLFYGPEGAGMDEQALHLSKGWLCVHGTTGSPCGECGTCRSFEGGRMVDFMLYRPWGPSNILKLDAVRPPKKDKKPEDDAPKPSLIEFFRTPPLMARHKVALFEQADRLNKDASNALLKTLEEPPPYAKVVLVTAEYSRMLPTVRSRCMSVACCYEASVEQDSMTRVFGPSPGLADRVAKHRSAYEGVWNVLESSRQAPPGAAIALSERLRDASDKLGDSLKLTARAGHAETLRCMSEWLVHNRSDSPDLAQKAVEAHRRVIGNVNVGPLFDSLWTYVTSS